jgi:excisionase family DNA binding protein
MSAHDYLTTAEAANYLKLSASMLAKGRVEGGNTPPFIKMGRSVRYRRSDLDRWATERLRTSTSDLGSREAA